MAEQFSFTLEISPVCSRENCDQRTFFFFLTCTAFEEEIKCGRLEDEVKERGGLKPSLLAAVGLTNRLSVSDRGQVLISFYHIIFCFLSSIVF